MIKRIFSISRFPFNGRRLTRGFNPGQANNQFDKDLYRILGVEKTADKAAIKASFAKLAKKHHPDINKSSGNTEVFKDINLAYSILNNEEKRKDYDQYLLHRQRARDFESSRSSASSANRTSYGSQYTRREGYGPQYGQYSQGQSQQGGGQRTPWEEQEAYRRQVYEELLREQRAYEESYRREWAQRQEAAEEWMKQEQYINDVREAILRKKIFAFVTTVLILWLFTELIVEVFRSPGYVYYDPVTGKRTHITNKEIDEYERAEKRKYQRKGGHLQDDGDEQVDNEIQRIIRAMDQEKRSQGRSYGGGRY